MFGTAALNALYKLAIHVIAKHYIATTPWAALVQNHIGGLFCVEKYASVGESYPQDIYVFITDVLRRRCLTQSPFATGDEP